MTMTATLAVTSGPVIAGARVNLLLTVLNSSATDYNLTSVALRVTPGTVPVTFGAWTPTVGQTVVVPNGSSLKVPMSLVFHGPNVGGAPGVAADDCLISADCFTSDGSVFSPPAQALAAATPDEEGVDTVGGGLALDSGYNSSNFVAIFL